MTRRQLVRRTLILCIHCTRNLAYYDAGWDGKKAIFAGQFLITTNSNFLDIAVLEWCKLFGDAKAEHHWKRVVPDADVFEAELYRRLSCADDDFKAFIKEVRAYRDKFVAHLDDEEIMRIPLLSKMRMSVMHLYAHLMDGEGQNFAAGEPTRLTDRYREWKTEAAPFYGAAR